VGVLLRAAKTPPTDVSSAAQLLRFALCASNAMSTSSYPAPSQQPQQPQQELQQRQLPQHHLQLPHSPSSHFALQTFSTLQTISRRTLAVMAVSGMAGGAFGVIKGAARPGRYALAFGFNSGALAFTCFSLHALLAVPVPDHPRVTSALAGAAGGGAVSGTMFGRMAGTRTAAACGLAGLVLQEIDATVLLLRGK
jgi:hypothetical protein